jgi:hypothetical protein
MNKARNTFNALAVVTFMLAFASLAQAQATRTWVSGVGDDANPCSRTAPCKTFQGAISKTAARGEINVIDPGGFGALTITKSLTIDASGGGGLAGVLTNGGNGMIINATGATDAVTLRGLDFNGLGQATNGIRILAAKSVNIDNCVIHAFTGRGITDERSVAGTISISDTTINNNGQSGIVIIPSAGGVTGTITNTRMLNNGLAGISVSSLGRITATNCIASGNASFGFFAEGPSGASELNLDSSVSNNNTIGVSVNTGSTITMSNVNVAFNTTGVSIAGGTVQSYGNNKVARNTNGNGPFPGGPIQQ